MQPQLTLDLLNNTSPACVDAEVLKRQLEVRDVWPHLPDLQHLGKLQKGVNAQSVMNLECAMPPIASQSVIL